MIFCKILLVPRLWHFMASLARRGGLASSLTKWQRVGSLWRNGVDADEKITIASGVSAFQVGFPSTLFMYTIRLQKMTLPNGGKDMERA